MSHNSNNQFEMILPILTILLIAIILFAVCRYWICGPRATSWLRSNGEEKIGLSKNKLYNANGYIVSFYYAIIVNCMYNIPFNSIPSVYCTLILLLFFLTKHFFPFYLFCVFVSTCYNENGCATGAIRI